MQRIFRCQFSCPVLEQKLGDPNQVQIAKRQCYILNSYPFKRTRIYRGTFSDCDLFRCHCHPSLLNVSHCSAVQRLSNRATFVEDQYFCIHRIELHSVTVIGCAQNKALYCNQLCTATAPHVPTFLKQFRFYSEY